MKNIFKLLDPDIQKWIYKQGWDDLREIQKKSIIPILSENTDVIISASTAAGKTEAAFLPACSKINNISNGFGILYISPLKALINDQLRRLESIGDMLNIEITPWHGDVLQSKKNKARKNPQGIILITPESLEAMLINNLGWVKSSFKTIKYIIIDEYHSFIGLERGNHLQSLMHRLEHLLGRQKTPIPRIALSATLGNMDSIPNYLRPENNFLCTIIKDTNNSSSIKIQLKGYINKEKNNNNSLKLSSEQEIARDLYKLLRGDSHLVFANSRARTEMFSAQLRDLCHDNLVPNEFFPHHGSLSKELRCSLESRLQKNNLPTTAICTMTLELGIDIGKVKSIAQITAPHSVSSLRQRLGRSGRRGDPSILRMFITEEEIDIRSNITDSLRIELLQSIAMTRLLICEKWYEPADTDLFHFSTLLHQILAIIAQWGSVRVEQAWSLLCKAGPFNNVTIGQYKVLLISMSQNKLILQLPSMELILGENGENLVSHYTFYSVFQTPDEYRVIANNKNLGTMPVDNMIIPGQVIIFAGKRWKILTIDNDKKTIHISAALGGKPPKFGGGGLSVHNKIRNEMLNIYIEGSYQIQHGDNKIDFMDSTGKSLFHEGLNIFQQLKLKNNRIIYHDGKTFIIPWMGDKVINTINILLINSGYKTSCSSGIIEVENTKPIELSNHIKNIINSEIPSNSELAKLVTNRQTEKYDHLLPDDLLNEGFGSKMFDIKNTIKWITDSVKLNYL